MQFVVMKIGANIQMPEIIQQRSIKQLPKYRNLTEIRQPLPAIASIMHRISGGALFLMLPFLIYLLQLSLGAPSEFETLKTIAGSPLIKLILLALLWGFLHHFCMGIRILLIDIHRGVDLKTARASTVAVFCISILLTLILGVKLW